MDYSNGTESEVSMDSVQLVAGLLICFPEFSKIRLDSKEKAVIMEISVREAPEKNLKRLNDLLRTALCFIIILSIPAVENWDLHTRIFLCKYIEILPVFPEERSA